MDCGLDYLHCTAMLKFLMYSYLQYLNIRQIGQIYRQMRHQIRQISLQGQIEDSTTELASFLKFFGISILVIEDPLLGQA